MASRIPPLVLVTVALGAFACAAYLYVRPPAEGPGLVVEEPDRVINHLTPGREHEVEFRVHNQTGQARQVVGAGGGGAGADCLT